MKRLLRCGLLVGVVGCNQLFDISEGTPRPTDAGAGTSGAGSSATGCTSNAQCLERSGEFEPSACVAGECVELLTPDCPLLLPQTGRGWLPNLRNSDPEPVIVGAFSQVPESLYGVVARTFDLALTEVTRTVGGLPAASGKRRPLVVLVCRNVYEDESALDAAIAHLIDEVRVPAVIAHLETAPLIRAFQRGGRARHVFFMSPLSAEQSLLDLDDDGLVWNMLPGGAALAAAYPALVNVTLEHLRNTGALAADEDARVAVVRADNIANLAETATALTRSIRYNGKSAAENAPMSFQAFSIISSDTGETASDYAPVIDALLKFAPHLIISAAGGEFPAIFMPALESAPWGERPTYLLSPWNYADGRLLELAQRFAPVDLRRRMLGVNFAGAPDKSLYDAYQARFDAAYPSFAGTPGLENYYDAAYYLIYAGIAAGPVSPLIGADFALGMPRLLAGRPAFDVGPEDLAAAYRALEDPASAIALNGTLGPPDFDARTGARATAGTVWCIAEDLRFETDVLRLDDDGQLAGRFPCYPFP